MSLSAFRLIGLLLAGCLASFGQTSTTQFSGTVTDSSGSLVPAASVTATNEATGLKYTLTTTGAGFYRWQSPRPTPPAR